MLKRNSEKVRDFAFDQFRRGVEPAAVIREIEVRGWRAGRSTVYGWWRTYREDRELDTSGRWLLARDTSGRPDLVLRVQRAQLNAWYEAARPAYEPGGAGTARLVTDALNDPPRWPAGGPPDSVSNADAVWIARVGNVTPDPGSDREALLDLLFIAREYVAAERRGDEDELAVLDAMVATHVVPPTRKED